MTEPTSSAGLPRHWSEDPHVCGADCFAAADRIRHALDEVPGVRYEPAPVAAAADYDYVTHLIADDPWDDITQCCGVRSRKLPRPHAVTNRRDHVTCVLLGHTGPPGDATRFGPTEYRR